MVNITIDVIYMAFEWSSLKLCNLIFHQVFLLLWCQVEAPETAVNVTAAHFLNYFTHIGLLLISDGL